MAQVDLFGVYVRSRLDSWGRHFALHRDCEYLGYSSRNALQVLIDHKGEMPPPNVGYKPLEVDREALQIETIVSDMARDGQLAAACCLRGYFCGQGRRKVERWGTANLLLANAGGGMVRLSVYRSLVDVGEAYIRGVLSSMAKK